jgi:hypothetical protein
LEYFPHFGIFTKNNLATLVGTRCQQTFFLVLVKSGKTEQRNNATYSTSAPPPQHLEERKKFLLIFLPFPSFLTWAISFGEM